MDKFITSQKVYCVSCLCNQHNKSICLGVQATAEASIIIINASAVSCTPKQIDLQAFFVTTAALSCHVLLLTSGCKLAAAQYKRH